jgi:hypothetical protein
MGEHAFLAIAFGLKLAWRGFHMLIFAFATSLVLEIEYPYVFQY